MQSTKKKNFKAHTEQKLLESCAETKQVRRKTML